MLRHMPRGYDSVDRHSPPADRYPPLIPPPRGTNACAPLTMTAQARATQPRRDSRLNDLGQTDRLTRLTVATRGLVPARAALAQNEGCSAANYPKGRCPSWPLPRSERCRRSETRRASVVGESELADGSSRSHPRSARPRPARRTTREPLPRPERAGRFLSSVPINSLTSTISVLSSMINSVRVAACQARMSITPRSPRTLNETSGAISQPSSVENQRATDSWRAACRALSRRSRSPPCQRTMKSMRPPRAPTTRSTLFDATSPALPGLDRDTTLRDTPALPGRSGASAS